MESRRGTSRLPEQLNRKTSSEGVVSPKAFRTLLAVVLAPCMREVGVLLMRVVKMMKWTGVETATTMISFAV
jgi:hypothetical protein